MDVARPRRRWPDFIRGAKHAAQPLGVPKRKLNVAVDRAFFEKDDDFAIRALPRIAALNPPRPVAKAALALGAAYLDGIFHRSDPISRSGSVPARVVTGTYPSMFNGRFAVCNAAVLPGKSPCRNPVAGV